MVDEEKNSILRETDDQARRQAKALIRSARFAALACLDTKDGAPLISQVNVVVDLDGSPGFLISSLSPHFSALETHSRCALLFGAPGKGDPAAHPRVSVAGAAYRLEQPADIDRVRRRFLARHPKSALYVDFADFAFWRVEVVRVSLNGGFGKAYEMTARDILSDPADCPGLESVEADAIAHMNADHSDAVALYATGLLNQQPGQWCLVSLDSEGLDLMLGDKIVRLWFDKPLVSADELRPNLMQLAQSARLNTTP